MELVAEKGELPDYNWVRSLVAAYLVVGHCTPHSAGQLSSLAVSG